MDKVDFKKTFPHYKAPAGTFTDLVVPAMTFIKIDGEGDPNHDPAYQWAVGWLFSVSPKLPEVSALGLKVSDTSRTS